MRDQDFQAFIAQAGEATTRREVPEETLVKYHGILPKKLLEYWQEEGWCGYADGLFWTVDPDEYKHLVDMWLEGTEYAELDNYHAIARSAFGTIYAWGEKYNRKITIACPLDSIVALKSQLQKPNSNPDLSISTFFAMFNRERYDLDDADGNFIFERALEKLGPLSESELYGFEPALFAGGVMSIEHVVKRDLDVHLTIIHQLR